MASYNYANHIEEAILSVLNQTYQDWELIVVDDNSSDGSLEIIQNYFDKDERIKFSCNSQNMGLSKTLRFALEIASGDWVAFLESDDFWAENHLQKKVEAIQKHSEVVLFFNKVDFIVEQERPQQKNYERTQNWLSNQSFPKNMFYDFGIDNKILTFSCVMARRERLLSLNFDTLFDCALDRWLWIQLAQNSEFYYINEPLTNWRLHENSYIQKKKPLFYFPQIIAYLILVKKDKNPFKLRLFILFSLFMSLISKFKNTL